MFPLAGDRFPTSASELADGLRDALAALVTPAEVDVEGSAYPAIERMAVKLDGARVVATRLPAKPSPVGDPRQALRVRELSVSGRGLRFDAGTLDMAADASDVELALVEDRAKRPLLVLSAAPAHARVELRIGRADLQSLALAAARSAARAQAVEVQDVSIDLRADGPRALGVAVEVRARKMLLRGTVRATATLSIADDLRVTLTNLACVGQGVIGSMAAAMVQPKLNPLDGRSFSAVPFPPGSVVMDEYAMDVTDGLHVVARVSRATPTPT